MFAFYMINMKQYIYADNAATTKLDTDAFKAMKEFLISDYANPSQPYSFSRRAKNAINEARELVASCIGANPDEVYFTSGGSESDNWAIKGVADRLCKSDNIISSSIEHHAVLNSLVSLEQRIDCKFLIPDKSGIVKPNRLKNLISDSTKLVSIMYGNNELGTIQPINELCEITHAAGAVFHTDAVQAVGHIPINVRNLNVDLMSASAHKFNGPKGIGFLYVKSGTDIVPLINGGSQEHTMRAGTENVASIVGMSVALEKNVKYMQENTAHIKRVENRFLKKLESSQINYIRNGQGNLLPGIINISFPGYSGEALLHRLDLMGICISTGAACNTINTEVSHVLKAIKIPDVNSKGTIRISFGKDNTLNDADVIVDALKKILL